MKLLFYAKDKINFINCKLVIIISKHQWNWRTILENLMVCWFHLEIHGSTRMWFWGRHVPGGRRGRRFSAAGFVHAVTVKTLILDQKE